MNTLIITLLTFGALTSQGYPIHIRSNEPICVVSLKGKNASGITLNEEMIPLAVPEYMNATTSTVGVPQCSQDFLFGYSKDRNVLSGFFITDEQVVGDIKVKK